MHRFVIFAALSAACTYPATDDGSYYPDHNGGGGGGNTSSTHHNGGGSDTDTDDGEHYPQGMLTVKVTNQTHAVFNDPYWELEVIDYNTWGGGWWNVEDMPDYIAAGNGDELKGVFVGYDGDLLEVSCRMNFVGGSPQSWCVQNVAGPVVWSGDELFVNGVSHEILWDNGALKKVDPDQLAPGTCAQDPAFSDPSSSGPKMFCLVDI